MKIFIDYPIVFGVNYFAFQAIIMMYSLFNVIPVNTCMYLKNGTIIKPIRKTFKNDGHVDHLAEMPI